MDLMERRRKLMQLQVLPFGYKAVEYIQSDGTSYIKTGVFPSSDIGFDCTFWTDNYFGNSNYGCLFGGRYSS